MEKTNVIKLKYLRAGQPSGREYTFYTPAPVEVGDIALHSTMFLLNLGQLIRPKTVDSLYIPRCFY